MNIDKKGILAGNITLLGWGLAGVFIKLLPHMDVLSIVSIRLSVSLIMIFPILFFLKYNIEEYLKYLTNIYTWFLGLVLFFCYLLGTLAFKMASIAEVATLMTLSPLFVLLFKFIRFGSLNKLEFSGIFIASLGVILIVFNQFSFQKVDEANRLFGDLYALLSSALFAFYAIYYKGLVKQNKAPNSVSIAISVFIYGSFLFVVLLIINIQTFNLLKSDLLSISYLLGISFLSTAIPTVSYTIASKYLTPILTSSILLLQPVVAIILAFIFISEIPSIFIFPGFVLISIGLGIIIKFK